MNKGATKQPKSKYDEIIKLPVSFDKAMGVLVKPVSKKKTKKAN